MIAKLDPDFIQAAQREIAAAGLDGWLLYDLEARNRVTAELTGLTDGISRRYFVLLRPGVPPRALAHRIELMHFEGWPGELISYVSWQEMEQSLRDILEGCGTIAMETSEMDAVPFIDNIPAGVLQMIQGLGVRVVSSADLLSRTYSQWGDRGRSLHLLAAEVLAETAEAAFRRAAETVSMGERIGEYEVATWILDELDRRNLHAEGVIVGTGPNSANPHYYPSETVTSDLTSGSVLLIDLWGRVRDEPEAVFADQTWMGLLGDDPPEGFMEAWQAVRAARDGAVAFIADRYDGELGPTGAQVDAEARRILIESGFEDVLFHRTGHAMDRVNHGYGPNLDSVETRDDRRLVRGIGFSVEPGVYFEGQWGIRSEINVHMGADGPEVSPQRIQMEPWTG